MPFLSPDVPRWLPQDEAALAAAATGGLLQESHYLDLKEAIPKGSSKNRELARDLASFAIDGGTLLIGLAERGEGPPALVPVELAGLAERIEEVARSIPDPPLPVTFTTITSSEQGRGYLLVEVPATGTAPHMVDGAYMGRGDKTKHKLSDAEVIRLHQARAQTEDRTQQLVDAYVNRDPIPRDLAVQAHAFVVAVPQRPREEMVLGLLPNGSWQQFLHRLLDEGAYTPGTVLAAETRYSPDLRSVGTFSRRPDGVALTYNLDGARRPMGLLRAPRPPGWEDTVELEVTEEGAVRVMTTRLGDDAGDDRGQAVFEDILPDLTRRTISIAGKIADLTGYQGPWQLGVAATGLAGKPAYGAGRASYSNTGFFDSDHDEYRRYATASAAELHQIPGAVTERLVGRFLRSIGFENSPIIRPFLDDHAP